MFRGLLSLFTSGLIIHPMVLLGIGVGLFASTKYNLQEIFAWMAVPLVYVVAVVIAFLYTFIFDRVYNGYSDKVDWKSTFERFIGNIFKLVLACACSIFLVSMLSF